MYLSRGVSSGCVGLCEFDLAEVPLKRFTINTQCCVCLESEMSEMDSRTGVTFGSSSSVHSFYHASASTSSRSSETLAFPL